MSFLSLKENKTAMLISLLPHKIAVLPGLTDIPELPGVLRQFGFEVVGQPLFIEVIRQFGFEVKSEPLFIAVGRQIGFEE